MKKRIFSLMLAGSLWAGCGTSADIPPVVDNGPPARNTSGTYLAGESIPLVSGGEWVEVGLFDGDNNRDLVVGMDGQVAVLIGRGDGTFDDPTPIANVTGDVLAVADLNGDGFLDVVASALDAPDFNILPGNGDGTFDAPIVVSTVADVNEVHSMDADGDGDNDLAVSLPSVDQVQVFNNGGNFQFTPGAQATVPDPRGLAIADYNLDGRPDIGATSDDPAGVRVILNLPAGLTLAGEGETASRGFSAASGDFNADGRPDLATIELDDLLSVWYGDGSGEISQPQQFQADTETFQVIAANLNGDNHTDIAVATRESGRVNVFIANAEGSFNRLPSLNSPLSISVAAGDVNGDGINDLITVTETPSVNVFLGQP